MPGCKCGRWHPANASVGPHFVVILAPQGDDLPGLGQGLEPVLVEAFVPEPAVEAFDIGVLGGLSRLDQDVLDASCLQPGHEGPAGEFRAVVGPDGLRVTSEACCALQHPGDIGPGHRQIHRDVDALAGEVIGDGQAFDSPAIGQCVADEVQAPGLVGTRGGNQRCALAAVLPGLVALAHRQALLAVEAVHLLVVGACRRRAAAGGARHRGRAPQDGRPCARRAGHAPASGQWPCACPAGLALYPEADLEGFEIQVGLGQQLLEPGILDLQLLQAPGFLGIHAAVLGPPLVERGLAETALSADLLDRQARFGLLQETDDLLLP